MRRFAGKKLDKEFLLFCGVILHVCTSVGRAMPSPQKAPHFSNQVMHDYYTLLV